MPVAKQSAADTSAHKPSGVLDRIKPIGFDPDDGLKTLVFGQSGSGKTTFWSSFPKPILCIVVSGGEKPGETRSIDTAENRKVISEVVPRHTDEVLELVTYAAQKRLFKTVVLDHATGFQDKNLAQITGKPIPEQKTWGTASQQQYGQCTMQCKEIWREMISLPINVVFVAQERVFKGGDGESDTDAIIPTVGANLMPQLGGWLNCAVDYIVNTYKRNKTFKKMIGVGKTQVEQTVTLKEIEYCLRTGPDATYTTKFRVPKGYYLPDSIVNPTYDDVKRIIEGKYPRPAPLRPATPAAKPGMKPGGK